jgi:modulator of FtsH protease HflC
MRVDFDNISFMDIVKKHKKKLILGGILFFLLIFGISPIFTTAPTDMANVRRLNSIVYDEPLGSGLHFKIPFIDKVDTIQVSLTTIHIPPFKVFTVDNQEVTLEMNFNYTIPKNKVNHLLYEIGKSGAVDIEANMNPVSIDKASRILAGQNMVTVNANREEIQAKITESVFKASRELFGIEPHSLQIKIIPSHVFIESNEAAVKAKNKAVEAENMKKTREYEAQQVVITAKGAADAAIENARGNAESQRLNAEATKIMLTLEGEGQAAKAKSEIAPYGSVDNYIRSLQARAMLNWDGKVPMVTTGQNNSGNIIIPVPMPTSK